METNLQTHSPVLSDVRLTRASEYIESQLIAQKTKVITQYELSLLVRDMYLNAQGKKLYLRSSVASIENYSRLRDNLIEANAAMTDVDYGARALIINKVQLALSAEDIICIVDQHAYVSHLSALQRWNLTNRRPKKLYLTRPSRSIMQVLNKEKMYKEYGSEEILFPLQIPSHPQFVRERKIELFETKNFGKSVVIRGSKARISTIGQTFLDTLQKPELCGGMSHVIQVWRRHAASWVDEIINYIERSNAGIIKCRAGYLLEEHVNILNHPIIAKWQSCAQRGGSRKLDPNRPHQPTYSEKWMISLNA